MTTSSSPQRRDTGLRRVSTITRWTLAGSLAGAGLFAGLASQVVHSSAAATSTRTRATSTAGTATAPGDDGGGEEGFVTSLAPQPVQAQVPVIPAPSSGFTPIVSGAS